MVFLVIISCACVSAVDDNATPVSADESSASDVGEDSSSGDSSDDDGGSTGDEEIDLDVTVDTGDESGAEESDGDNDEPVSISLEKHVTGNPILLLVMIVTSFLLPIVGRK